MFKRLRRQFMTFSMGMISVFLLVALAVIFLVTGTFVLGEQRSFLHAEARGGMLLLQEGAGVRIRGEWSMPAGQAAARPGMPEVVRSFTVLLKDTGEYAVYSRMSAADEAYGSVLAAARAAGKAEGQLHVESGHFLYCAEELPGGRLYTFLDISREWSMLLTLAAILVVVGLSAGVAIYFMSRLFARRAILPVRAAWERQNQFLLDASHELKMPLTIISANADLLLSDPEATVRSQEKWLTSIKTETGRMTKLTEGLLTLARRDMGGVRTPYVPVELSRLLSDIALFLEAAIFEEGTSFQTDIAPGVVVMGDAEELRQVFLNLLDNARKYVNPGGEVSLSLSATQREAVVAVRNTGEGMEEAHLSKIFDRFYRTDASRARESGGYGLGLSIVAGFVEAHRGTVSVSSVMEEFTEFTVQLPLKGERNIELRPARAAEGKKRCPPC